MIFKNGALVPISLWNRWHNTIHLGVQIIYSHIFWEGNCCVDKLTNMGHSLQGPVWLTELLSVVRVDFFRGRFGWPNYRFPYMVFFPFLSYFPRVLANSNQQGQLLSPKFIEAEKASADISAPTVSIMPQGV